MATVRAQRLLNGMMTGTVNAAQLQTLLATSSNLSDYQQLVNERGKARLMTNSANSIGAVFGSDLAFSEYANSTTAGKEMSISTIGTNVFINNAAAVAGSSAKMNAVFANPSLRTNVFSNANLAATIVNSQYMPSQWNKFLLQGSANVPQPVFKGRPFGMSSITGAAYGNGVWALVGGGTGRVIRSTDNSVTWSSGAGGYSENGSTNVWSGVTYGNGLFVAVGQAGRVMTSATGAGDWVQRTGGWGTSNLLGVHYGQDKFVLSNGSGYYYSSDGITWTAGTVLTNNGLIDYGNGRWYCGASSGAVNTSTDGISWTSVANFFANSRTTASVCFSGGVWVISADNLAAGVLIRTSTDGSSWTNVGANSFNTANALNKMGYANGLFFIATNTNGGTLISPNGYSWTNTEVQSGQWNNLVLTAFKGANGQCIFYDSTNGNFYTLF